jgi:hypothetical protein
MNAQSAHEQSKKEVFDSRGYLLARYGLRMNKKEVCFEAKKSRATIDNMRNPRHRSYDRCLAEAEVEAGRHADSGSPVLFKTAAIADWFDEI